MNGGIAYLILFVESEGVSLNKDFLLRGMLE